MLKKIFTIEGIKAFFKVRDENGDPDWQQALATAIQTALVLATLYVLWYIGVL